MQTSLIEGAQRKKKREIEQANYALAKRLYSTRPALNKIYNFKKDYNHHLKIKSLRC